MVNSIVVVFFYRPQPITTDLISKMHEKSLALTLFSKLCQCKGQPKLPKTSLAHETERQTDAGGATITSYIMPRTAFAPLGINICTWPKAKNVAKMRHYALLPTITYQLAMKRKSLREC